MCNDARSSQWWDGTSKNLALQQRPRLWNGSTLKEGLVARNAFVIERQRGANNGGPDR